jgi:ketosteroid isomerase-like protein
MTGLQSTNGDYMKKTVIIGSLVCVLCVCVQAVTAAPKREADHKALRVLKEKAEQAFNSGDMDKLNSCFCKEFTLITSDQAVITNRAEIANYWNKMFKSKKSPLVSVKCAVTPEILTQFTDKDSGYCYGRSRDVYTLKNGRKIAMESRWSVVLAKEDGEWKIYSAHLGVNFLDNPVLKAGEMSWFGRLGVFLHPRKLPGEVKE